MQAPSGDFRRRRRKVYKKRIARSWKVVHFHGESPAAGKISPQNGSAPLQKGQPGAEVGFSWKP